jgi:hypothetical protein
VFRAKTHRSADASPCTTADDRQSRGWQQQQPTQSLVELCTLPRARKEHAGQLARLAGAINVHGLPTSLPFECQALVDTHASAMATKALQLLAQAENAAKQHSTAATTTAAATNNDSDDDDAMPTARALPRRKSAVLAQSVIDKKLAVAAAANKTRPSPTAVVDDDAGSSSGGEFAPKPGDDTDDSASNIAAAVAGESQAPDGDMEVDLAELAASPAPKPKQRLVAKKDTAAAAKAADKPTQPAKPAAAAAAPAKKRKHKIVELADNADADDDEDAPGSSDDFESDGFIEYDAAYLAERNRRDKARLTNGRSGGGSNPYVADSAEHNKPSHKKKPSAPPVDKHAAKPASQSSSSSSSSSSEEEDSQSSSDGADDGADDDSDALELDEADEARALRKQLRAERKLAYADGTRFMDVVHKHEATAVAEDSQHDSAEDNPTAPEERDDRQASRTRRTAEHAQKEKLRLSVELFVDQKSQFLTAVKTLADVALVQAFETARDPAHRGALSSSPALLQRTDARLCLESEYLATLKLLVKKLEERNQNRALRLLLHVFEMALTTKDQCFQLLTLECARIKHVPKSPADSDAPAEAAAAAAATAAVTDMEQDATATTTATADGHARRTPKKPACVCCGVALEPRASDQSFGGLVLCRYTITASSVPSALPPPSSGANAGKAEKIKVSRFNTKSAPALVARFYLCDGCEPVAVAANTLLTLPRRIIAMATVHLAVPARQAWLHEVKLPKEARNAFFKSDEVEALANAGWKCYLTLGALTYK